jgi:hypothetical protein
MKSLRATNREIPMTDWQQFFRERSALEVQTSDSGPTFSGLTDITSVPALMAFRKIWDPYVMGVARAQQTASTKTTVDPVMQGSFAQGVQNLMTLWNQYAGLSASDIALRANDILAGYRDAVSIAQKDADLVKSFAPDIKIPPLPTAEIVATVERGIAGAMGGYGVAAQGVNQLGQTGAQGAGQTLEAFIPGSGVTAPGFLGPVISQFKTYAIIGGIVVLGAVVLPELLPMMFAARAASK